MNRCNHCGGSGIHNAWGEPKHLCPYCKGLGFTEGGVPLPPNDVDLEAKRVRAVFEDHERAIARRLDPPTSHEAADSVDVEGGQRAVLAALEALSYGSDADIWAELEQRGAKISPSGARTRRKELVDMGLARDSGMRIRLDSGRRAIVWEPTGQGGR